MRVAILSPYTDPVKGGITSYTRELVSGYRELGLETLGLAEAGESNAGFEVLAGTKVGFCARSTLRMLQWKADVIHGHSHWPELLAALAAKILRPRTRVIFTLHTPPDDEGGAAGFLHRARRAVVGIMLGLCDGISFVSRETAQMTSLPPRVPRAVVHAAPERSIGDPRIRALASTRQRVVLAVSVLVWPKKVEGLLLLLDAFAAIAPLFPEWRLAIVGDGPLRPRVTETISGLGLGNRVVLRGLVDDVAREMVGASVFTQISFHEGLPIALLNAMGLGLPVIATAAGGMPEVIQQRVTGLIVEPTKEAVSGALRDLLEDPELRRRMGEAARSWTEAELSWKKVARENLTLVGMAPQ